MTDDEEVAIYVDVSKEGNKEFDAKWLLDRQSPTKLTKQIHDLARQVLDKQALRAVMAEMFTIAPSEDAQEVIGEAEEDEANPSDEVDGGPAAK